MCCLVRKVYLPKQSLQKISIEKLMKILYEYLYINLKKTFVQKCTYISKQSLRNIYI